MVCESCSSGLDALLPNRSPRTYLMQNTTQYPFATTPWTSTSIQNQVLAGARIRKKPNNKREDKDTALGLPPQTAHGYRTERPTARPPMRHVGLKSHYYVHNTSADASQPPIRALPLPHIHKRAVPSAPPDTHQASLGCQSMSNTPNLLTTLCPFKTFTGTIVGFSSWSFGTRPWKICRLPSSLASAKSGRPPLWNRTCRMASPWNLIVL